VSVKSDCYFWVVCEAPTADEAIELVSREKVPLLQIALSLRKPHEPYRVEVLWAERGEERVSAFSGRVGVCPFRPRDLDNPERVAADLDVMERNDLGKKAAETLSEAIFQTDTGESAAQEEGALLSFFKVIEMISRHVAKGLPVPADLEATQTNALTMLRQTLGSAKSTRHKVDAVHETSKALQRAERRYLDLQIAATAQKLGLSDEWLGAAREFANLRNKRIGHGGASTSVAERVQPRSGWRRRFLRRMSITSAPVKCDSLWMWPASKREVALAELRTFAIAPSPRPKATVRFWRAP
jgi:hypothetical protein